MQATVLLPSPVKDGRRILGEKTSNAYLSPARNRNVDAKRLFFENVSPKKLLPSPSFVGQKRTIDQVDDDTKVNNGNLQHVQRVEPHGHDLQFTVKDDGRPSSEQPDAMDSHDVLPPTQSEQLSQQQQPSNDSTSLNEDSRPINAINTPQIVPDGPDTRKLFIQEKASLLRTKIQSAMRHVRDHQFDRRVSELEAHIRKYPRLSLPSPSQQTPLREREATTPSSEITPRCIQRAIDIIASSENTSNAPPGLSSPPLSSGNANHKEDPMRTPTQKSHHRRTPTAESLIQLSSPPATISRSSSDRTAESSRLDADNATEIPSQQGDAVDGLLKLMNTPDQNTNADTWTG